MPNFETIKIAHDKKVAEIILNRPEKANSLNAKIWQEIGEAMEWADLTPEVRCVLLRSEGPHFCAGIDLDFVAEIAKGLSAESEGRKQEKMRAQIVKLQASMTAVEKCRKPVIALVQGVCFGAGVDLIAACDIRYAAADASFSVKEVDVGIVADIGTLQRLPRIVGEGVARDLALTARTVKADEGRELGLVSKVLGDYAALLDFGREQAGAIARKSPLAVRGTKQILNYSRDHSVADGLEFVATWNAGMLLSQDLMASVEAFRSKRAAEFAD